jgi:hypothetical protein
MKKTTAATWRPRHYGSPDPAIFGSGETERAKAYNFTLDKVADADLIARLAPIIEEIDRRYNGDDWYEQQQRRSGC